MGDRHWAGKPSWYNHSQCHLGQLNLSSFWGVGSINEYRQYARVKGVEITSLGCVIPYDK